MNQKANRSLKLAALGISTLMVSLASAEQTDRVKPGDLVFQRSASSQASAIAVAEAASPEALRFTHCGIVIQRNGELFVAEAINPVRVIQHTRSLKEWVAAAADGKATVMRLHNGINADQMPRLLSAMQRMEGKPYDALFQWNDRAIYCSEFIYKAFDHGLGLKLGTVQHKNGRLDCLDLP